jgi:hypothetical protein
MRVHAVSGKAARRPEFMHFSSATVFGFDLPDGVDELYPVHFTFVPYPDSKISSEHQPRDSTDLLADIAGGVPAGNNTV